MIPGKEGCVLVVEDEVLIALSISDTLEEIGFRVCATADTAHRALELADMHRPILVLMDIRLRGTEDGVDAAREIHHRYGTPIIFVTGSCEQEIMDRIKKVPGAAVLIKPILPHQLQGAVKDVLG